MAGEDIITNMAILTQFDSVVLGNVYNATDSLDMEKYCTMQCRAKDAV
jgi:hypothetical protein